MWPSGQWKAQKMQQTFIARSWKEKFSTFTQELATKSLEQGQVLYFPGLNFALSTEEQRFLSPHVADPRSKNIGYGPKENKLWGVQRLNETERARLMSMLDRFSRHALGLIAQLFPYYAENLLIGRTSYRPVEITGRKASFRKDDKRLHVDAFPSAPNQGQRILRVFSNINPHGQDRIWRLGEPFEKIAKRFLPSIKKPIFGAAATLKFLGITKSHRSLYDHYMLHLHDNMKADDHYQKESDQKEVRFPPGCTWIVQTDQVSHAAMAGQYVLEQTFYLPVSCMQDESRAPLRVLEKLLGKNLV